MMDKIAVLSLLVASLSVGASATEMDTEVKEAPAVEIENSEAPAQDISLEEPKDKVEDLDVLKKEKCKDTEKDCEEEKMTEEEDAKPEPKPKDSDDESSSKED